MPVGMRGLGREEDNGRRLLGRVRMVERMRLVGGGQQPEQLMMRMVGVWVFMVVPHESKAWHRQRGQEEP
jgi:hypothetical protein